MVWPTSARAHFHQYTLGDLTKARQILMRCLHQTERNHPSTRNGVANAQGQGPSTGQGQGLGQWGQGQGLDLEVDLQLDADSDERPSTTTGVSFSTGTRGGGVAGMGGPSRSASGPGPGLEVGEESSHNRTRRSERTALLTSLAYVCLEMDDDASAYR